MNNSPLPRQFALDISHIPTPSLSNFLAGENIACLLYTSDAADE